MERLYIIPLSELTLPGNPIIYQGPKYLKFEFPAISQGADTGLDGIIYALRTYDGQPLAFICCDVTTAQHSILAAKSDVLTIPTNLDNTITSGAISTVETFFGGTKIPTGWITTNYTYRTIVRVTVGMFMFAGRLGVKLKIRRFLDSFPLSTTLAQLPVAARNKLENTADSFGIDYSSLTGSDSIKDALILMGKHWANREVVIGTYRV
jgi:hypothetical protein